MYTFTSITALAALIASVHSHAVILKAVGDSGASQGFLVDPTLARNCTTISPCQQDATIIRNSEITQNIVNSCGRTEIAGNIDVGEQTEKELSLGRVTTVSSGSTIKMTIHQVNADGAGPFECDMDQTSNGATNFIPLTVTDNIPGANGLSGAKEQDFTINIAMPQQFNCIGASTGNICTVRCRNTAVAGPFGGCIAVQQTDGTGRTNTTAAGVDTAQTLAGVLAQVEQNKKDLPAAIAANVAAGAAGGNEGASAISALITATLDPAAAATPPPAGNTGKTGKGKNGNAAAAAGNNANAAKGKAGAGQAAAGNAAAGNAAAGNAAAGNAAAGNAAAGNAAAGKGKAGAGNAAAGNAAKGQAGAGQAAAGNAATAGNAAAGNNANAAAGNNANAATAQPAAGNTGKGKGANNAAAANNANAATAQPAAGTGKGKGANAAAAANTANAAAGAAGAAQAAAGAASKGKRGQATRRRGHSAFLAEFGL